MNITKLAKTFNIHRTTAARVLDGVTDEEEAKAALKEYQGERDKAKTAQLDPVSGLTWWAARQREACLRERAKRETERQAAGGELIPVKVIEEAARMSACKFQALADNLYALGIALDQEQRQVVTRLGTEFQQDFTSWCRQFLERQAEIAKGK